MAVIVVVVVRVVEVAAMAIVVLDAPSGDVLYDGDDGDGDDADGRFCSRHVCVCEERQCRHPSFSTTSASMTGFVVVTVVSRCNRLQL